MYPKSIKSCSIILALVIIFQLISVLTNFGIHRLLDSSKKGLDQIQNIEKEFYKVLSLETMMQETSSTPLQITTLYNVIIKNIEKQPKNLSKNLLENRKKIFQAIYALKGKKRVEHSKIRSLLPNLADSIQYIHSHHIAYLRNMISNEYRIRDIQIEQGFKKKHDDSAPETHIIETTLKIHSSMHMIYETFSKVQSGLSPAAIRKEFKKRIKDFYLSVNQLEDYSLDAQDGILIEELLIDGRKFENSFQNFLDFEIELAALSVRLLNNKTDILSMLEKESQVRNNARQFWFGKMVMIQGFSIIISIVTFLLLFWYGWLIVAGLRKTVQETRKIQENIEYRSPDANDGFKELSVIFDALNSMADTITRQMSALKNAKNLLEERVEQRTIELHNVNRQLKKEIKDRIAGEQQRIELEKQLFQAHKMESIGTLAGGIAHDFNNILSGMIGFSQLTKKHVKTNPEKAGTEIDQVIKGALRASELVKQILTFSRKTEPEKQILNMTPIVKEVLKLIRSTIPAYIDLNEKLLEKAMILADPGQIHQVAMNLCTNAAQAMNKNGGTLSVRILQEHILPEQVPGKTSIKQGNYIVLEVEDTGTGIEKENLDKIFDPYFTTKSVGDGTGLGLATVHTIIQNHDGFITVQSKKGKGSCFKAGLPQVKAVETTIPETSSDALDLYGNEHLMIVDDEPAIRDSYKELLEDYGYTITTFSDGESALLGFEASPDSFDLILSDVSMPKMSGDILARHILAEKETIPIILSTGYSERADKAEAFLHENCRILQKPINTEKLLALIRKLLYRHHNR